MDWIDGYIAVDWGTTNRRAYRVDRGGNCVDEEADGCGVLSIGSDGFEAEVAGIRARLGELPMLLAGMVGSNRGWREAPYIDCPASPEAIAAQILWVEPGRTGIVPGVCQRGDNADVMRGEEVQAIGAVRAEKLPEASLVCHPGTHSKWITMQGSAITAFRTGMTGEIFALLQRHSILAAQMQGEARDGPAFRSAVRRVLDGAEPMTELFSIRARALLEPHQVHDAVSFASGLLIGADVRSALVAGSGSPPMPVAVVGRSDLCALYAVALEEAGRPSQVIDGSSAFLAGISALVEKL